MTPGRSDAAPMVWRQAFTVRAYEVGPGETARLLTLCDYVQEAAGEHARALGVERFTLPSGVGAWVLHRLRIEVGRRPRWRETVTVETWPSAHDGLRARRDALLLDAGGGVVARAATHWLVLDLARRRPLRLPDAVTRLAPPDRPFALPLPDAPTALAGDAETELRATVGRADLDRNAHANNVRFAAWALDAGPPDQNPASLDLAFRAEAVRGDALVSRARPDGGAVAHEIVRERDGATLAVARSTWAAP